MWNTYEKNIWIETKNIYKLSDPFLFNLVLFITTQYLFFSYLTFRNSLDKYKSIKI